MGRDTSSKKPIGRSRTRANTKKFVTTSNKTNIIDVDADDVTVCYCPIRFAHDKTDFRSLSKPVQNGNDRSLIQNFVFGFKGTKIFCGAIPSHVSGHDSLFGYLKLFYSFEENRKQFLFSSPSGLGAYARGYEPGVFDGPSVVVLWSGTKKESSDFFERNFDFSGKTLRDIQKGGGLKNCFTKEQIDEIEKWENDGRRLRDEEKMLENIRDRFDEIEELADDEEEVDGEEVVDVDGEEEVDVDGEELKKTKDTTPPPKKRPISPSVSAEPDSFVQDSLAQEKQLLDSFAQEEQIAQEEQQQPSFPSPLRCGRVFSFVDVKTKEHISSQQFCHDYAVEVFQKFDFNPFLNKLSCRVGSFVETDNITQGTVRVFERKYGYTYCQEDEEDFDVSNGNEIEIWGRRMEFVVQQRDVVLREPTEVATYSATLKIHHMAKKEFADFRVYLDDRTDPFYFDNNGFHVAEPAGDYVRLHLTSSGIFLFETKGNVELRLRKEKSDLCGQSYLSTEETPCADMLENGNFLACFGLMIGVELQLHQPVPVAQLVVPQVDCIDYFPDYEPEPETIKEPAPVSEDLVVEVNNQTSSENSPLPKAPKEKEEAEPPQKRARSNGDSLILDRPLVTGVSPINMKDFDPVSFFEVMGDFCQEQVRIAEQNSRNALKFAQVCAQIIKNSQKL